MHDCFLQIVVISSQIYFVENGRDENGGRTPTGNIELGPTLDDGADRIGVAILHNLKPVRLLSIAGDRDISSADRGAQAMGFKNYDDFLKKARLIFVELEKDAISFISMRRRSPRSMNFEFGSEMLVDKNDVNSVGGVFLKSLSRSR